MVEDQVGGICARIGEAPVRDVVRRFYAQVPDEPALAPLYPPDDLAGAEQRLADFLVMRLGGSRDYAAKRGNPRLRMRHAKFAIGRHQRDRWVALMDKALDEGAIAEPERKVVRAFLHEVATFLINASGPR